MCFFKCIRELLSEKPFAMKVLTSRKNSWNLQKSTFTLPFLHYEPNLVRKSRFQSDLRVKDSLLTRWLLSRSILAVIDRINRYQFKSNYLKNHRVFAIFVLHFLYLHEISNVLKKSMCLKGQVFLKLFTPK